MLAARMVHVTIPESTWFLERAELLEVFVEDEEQPFPPLCGARVRPRAKGVEGYRDFAFIEDGLATISSDIRFKEQVTISHPDRPFIKFHYRLSGTSHMDFAKWRRAEVIQHTGGALFMPGTMIKSEAGLAGQHEQSLTIICSTQWLARRVENARDHLPEALVEYCLGTASEFFYLPITLRSSISTAAAALLSCELTGMPRLMFFEAKALEILALSLDGLIAERAAQNGSDIRLSKLELGQIYDARKILQRDFITPQKLPAIAERVGLSESRLLQSFKRLYGETVFDFAQRLRMEYAAKLLESTTQTITEIALEVGYDYPSNFTTAFKRHFGVPPSAVRAGQPRLQPAR